MTSCVRAFSLTQTLSRWERDFLDDLWISRYAGPPVYDSGAWTSHSGRRSPDTIGTGVEASLSNGLNSQPSNVSPERGPGHPMDRMPRDGAPRLFPLPPRGQAGL